MKRSHKYWQDKMTAWRDPVLMFVFFTPTLQTPCSKDNTAALIARGATASHRHIYM